MPDEPTTAALLSRLLDTIESDILPLTERGVEGGSKVFGAALLARGDLSTVLAETNNEIESPLHHGEMHLLKRYHEWPAQHRPPPSSLLFLTTHEPCTMCASAIAWSGFKSVYYLFSHEDSRDSFDIPHDLRMLKELFDVEPGGYRRNNAYFQASSLRSLADTLAGEAHERADARIASLVERYAGLSERYQQGKHDNRIPLN